MAPTADSIARRVAARALRRDLIAALGTTLTVAAAISLVWILLSKWLPPVRELAAIWVAPAVLAGLAIVAAAVWASRRRWSLDQASIRADAALRLRDRLTNARSLANTNDAFARWALIDGEQAAASADPSRVVAIRWSTAWTIWPSIAAVALASVLLIPQRARAKSSARELATALTKTQDLAVQQVSQAAKIAQAATPDLAATPATARALESLNALQNELAAGKLSPDDARTQGARQLQQAADELQQDAELAKAAQDRLRDRLAEAATRSDPPQDAAPPSTPGAPSPVESLREQLAGGRFDAAARTAEELANLTGTLSPSEREAIARDLESLAGAMDSPTPPNAAAPSPSNVQEPTRNEASEATTPKPPDPVTPQPSPERDPGASPRNSKPSYEPSERQTPKQDQPQSGQSPVSSKTDRSRSDTEPPSSQESTLNEDTRQELQRQGVPPEGQEEAAKQPNREAIQRELERRGVSPGVAQELARRINAQRQEGNAEKLAEKQADTVREALREAARELRGNPAPRNPTPDTKTSSQSGRESREPTANADRRPSGEQPTQQQPDGSQPESPNQRAPEQGRSDQPGSKEQSGQTPSSPTQGIQPDPSRPRPDGKSEKPEPGPGGKSPQEQAAPSGDTGRQPSAPQSNRQGDRGTPPQPGGVPAPTPHPEPGKGTQGPTTPGSEQQSPSAADRPGDQPGGLDDTPDTGRGGSGLNRLRQALRDTAQQQRDAQRRQDGAEDLRQAAEDLLRGASPAERQRLRELARKLRDRQPEPPAPDPTGKPTVPVDARGTPTEPPTNERTIAEWYSDRPLDRSETPGVSREAMGEAVQRAAAGAQQAIESQQVPARHAELVKRVFRRYVERTQPAKNE